MIDKLFHIYISQRKKSFQRLEINKFERKVAVFERRIKRLKMIIEVLIEGKGNSWIMIGEERLSDNFIIEPCAPNNSIIRIKYKSKIKYYGTVKNHKMCFIEDDKLRVDEMNNEKH